MGQERPTYAELLRLVERQTKLIEEQELTIKELRQEVRQLRRQVEDLQTQLREAHRSTAPFRRRENLKKPEAEKKRPGCKAGHPGAYRQRPEQIDQTVEVPLSACPHCAGELQNVEERTQFIRRSRRSAHCASKSPPGPGPVRSAATWRVGIHCRRRRPREPREPISAPGRTPSHCRCRIVPA